MIRIVPLANLAREIELCSERSKLPVEEALLSERRITRKRTVVTISSALDIADPSQKLCTSAV